MIQLAYSKIYIERLKERFWKNVDLDSFATDEDCWLWKGLLRGGGYGEFSIVGRKVQAHKLSFELYRKTVPQGYILMHTCDVRNCVNPNHLKIGTCKDNSQDMSRKKRNAYQKGDKGHNAAFTLEQVAEIKKIYATGISQSKIAELYKVAQSTICLIVNNKVYNKV